MKNPFLLGVCGGSGAGKSTLAFGLEDRFPHKVLVVHLDDYFRPEAGVPLLHGMKNWDSPDAVYHDKIVADLKLLKSGQPVTINTKSPRLNPDFLKTGKRIPVLFEPKPLIVVEGFLTLHYPLLRGLLDIKIYLDAPYELHSKRRVHGKLYNFLSQYNDLVLKPMHNQYVLPSKQYADVAIDIAAKNQQQVLDEVCEHLSGLLEWV
jgi:uridine kinase